MRSSTDSRWSSAASSSRGDSWRHRIAGRPSGRGRLRIHVLGDFRLERDGAPLDLGVKPPTRSLDLLRRLAIANGQTLSLDDVYESLWPDADGDQAKAACEQALHRLRRLLGPTDFVSQREGKLRLLRDRVWVDLDAWQIERDRALRMHPSEAALDELDRIFWRFPGPLFQGVSEKAWSLPASERVRSELVDLATQLGGHWDAKGAHGKAERSMHAPWSSIPRRSAVTKRCSAAGSPNRTSPVRSRTTIAASVSST